MTLSDTLEQNRTLTSAMPTFQSVNYQTYEQLQYANTSMRILY